MSSDTPANEDDLDFQINGPTTLDLESFITNYEGKAHCLPNTYFFVVFKLICNLTGNILIERLRFVALHSEQHQIEALTLGLKETIFSIKPI